MENKIPSWVYRAMNDQWNFGLLLKNGLRIGFGTCTSGPGVDNEIWIHLEPTEMDSEEDDGCIKLNSRGMDVRLSEVAAFWERCTT